MIPEFGYQSDFILLVGMFLYPSHFSGAKLNHEVVSGNLSACLCLPLESFLQYGLLLRLWESHGYPSVEKNMTANLQVR